MSLHASHSLTSPFISLHLHSSPLNFLVLCFPLHSPLLIPFPFISLSVPLHVPSFPVISTSSYFLFMAPSCPRHFPALPLHFPFIPRYLFENNIVFFNVFATRISKPLSFSRFAPKGGRKPAPAKSRQGDSSLGALFCPLAPQRLFFSRT